jgi:hypothetical protein
MAPWLRKTEGVGRPPKADALKKFEVFNQNNPGPRHENHLPKAFLAFQNIESC